MRNIGPGDLMKSLHISDLSHSKWIPRREQPTTGLHRCKPAYPDPVGIGRRGFFCCEAIRSVVFGIGLLSDGAILTQLKFAEPHGSPAPGGDA